MKFVKPKKRNPGDKSDIQEEEKFEEIEFNIHKFNNRKKPSQPVIVSCFAEFGCESLVPLYCLPRIIKRHPGSYIILVGWHGRSYLYEHLVDEYWEMKPEYMHLRENSRAFHYESQNLSALENCLKDKGVFYSSKNLGWFVVGTTCLSCSQVWEETENRHLCPFCHKATLEKSLFHDISGARKEVVRIPTPSDEKMEYVKKFLGPKPVGVFARGRKCYGRNLQEDFYVGLINRLESKGYTPIWLGEKVSTQPCPLDHIVDFSRMDESRDLETLLAIIAQCEFTVQFWTASTRFAGMMGVPYILYESPDQIWGQGQEGYRRNLNDFGPSKMVVAHYLNVYNNTNDGLDVFDVAVQEVENQDYSNLVDKRLIENEEAINYMVRDNESRIGTI